ncbi:manganese efflux pump [Geobacillus stearothermophilus]|uniref:manganese efflux pump n=1 Tax=Geobacillus stearothermophilus TaxID=1422 RepID=UPI002E1E52CA|nr:manganese efflux pump [Geobacillus stearothermophilus]MED4299183.1 manganese efflux pump [Geobacillus stearothermophilus]
MWLWVSMILLAFSVSMDSLSVGMTYGMSGVRFSFVSLALIAFMSGAVVFASMNIGRLLALFLPLQVERGLASVILMALGGEREMKRELLITHEQLRDSAAAARLLREAIEEAVQAAGAFGQLSGHPLATPHSPIYSHPVGHYSPVHHSHHGGHGWAGAIGGFAAGMLAGMVAEELLDDAVDDVADGLDVDDWFDGGDGFDGGDWL